MKKPIKPCECGGKRPYRRALACAECWNALSEVAKAALLRAQGNKRTLRLTD